jgi:demethylmenaquinone methyltransferase/2-methoxy-6-polyprenyl-1,4-benzoquinol methylase
MPGLDHFSLLAPFYDRVFAEFDPVRLRGLLALPAARLLDVGGGTGRIAKMLGGDAGLVVVTDASRAMLGEARGKPGLLTAQAHAERLPYPDGCFDRVLVVDAFHHFRDHPVAARELLRVVAPGGRLVVEEMNLERWQVKLIALGERLLLMGSRFYHPEELRRLFAADGARVTAHVDEGISMWIVAEKENER